MSQPEVPEGADRGGVTTPQPPEPRDLLADERRWAELWRERVLA